MGILNAFPSQSKQPMTAEMKDIKRLLNELEDFDLTDSEMDFVASLQDKISLYEGGTYISDKQEDWLNRLADKYDLDPA